MILFLHILHDTSCCLWAVEMGKSPDRAKGEEEEEERCECSGSMHVFTSVSLGTPKRSLQEIETGLKPWLLAGYLCVLTKRGISFGARQIHVHVQYMVGG